MDGPPPKASGRPLGGGSSWRHAFVQAFTKQRARFRARGHLLRGGGSLFHPSGGGGNGSSRRLRDGGRPPTILKVHLGLGAVTRLNTAEGAANNLINPLWMLPLARAC